MCIRDSALPAQTNGCHSIMMIPGCCWRWGGCVWRSVCGARRKVTSKHRSRWKIVVKCGLNLRGCLRKPTVPTRQRRITGLPPEISPDWNPNDRGRDHAIEITSVCNQVPTLTRSASVASFAHHPAFATRVRPAGVPILDFHDRLYAAAQAQLLHLMAAGSQGLDEFRGEALFFE